MNKLNDTTWKEIPKNHPKDLVEVFIGDSKQPDFKPQAKIQRWDNEANVSIRLKETPEELLETPTITEVNSKIEYKKSKREAHFYDIAPNAEHPEGAFETEIILLEKPDTNITEFTLVDKDVDYFFQPPLTPEEIADGARSPENVVGSYAVYAKTSKTNYTGGKEYKCGKIGHIFRPKIIDSAGTEVWGDLHIENEILSVTIPQEFLDNAVYPVRHAAGLTFGYTTLGASQGLSSSTTIRSSSTVYAGAVGTVSSISVGSSVASGTSNVTVAIYNTASPASLISGSPTIINVTSSTKGFWTGTCTPSITAVNYNLAFFGDPTNTPGVAYDTTIGTLFKTGQTYPTFPSTITWGTGGSSATFSIYATYTASGGTNTTGAMLAF
jgi:hypothetical protein